MDRALTLPEQTAIPAGARRMPGSAGLALVSRQIVAGVSAVVLLGALGVSLFYYERLQPPAVAVAVPAAATFIWASGWHARRRGLTVALLLDVLLIFGYMWSLDEGVTVSVYATARGYVARVGAQSITLPVRGGAGVVRLYDGDLRRYPAHPGAGRLTQTSLLTRLALWLRFVVPRPAWSDITLKQSPATPAQPLNVRLVHGWAYNRRGELESAPDAAPLSVGTLSPAYRFSAVLMRGDGEQAVLVRVGRNRGYMLLIRSDQERAYWAPWTGRADAPVRWTGTHVPHLSFPLLSMVQRTLLFALPSAILALTLLLLVIPLYALFQLLTAGITRVFPLQRMRERGRATTAAGALRGQGNRPSRLARTADLAAVASAAWGLLVAAYIADGILGAVPNVQDSVAYLFQARVLASGRLWAPVPHLPPFFQQTDILMYHGHWFGKYPLGWPAVLAVGVKLGLDWLVNPVLLAGCLLLTYLIGRRIYGRSVALLGTAFAASSPFLLYMAGTFMAHTAALFFFLAGIYLCVIWKQSEERTDGMGLTLRGGLLLVPAGLALGWAGIARPLDTVGLAAPFAILFVRRPLALIWPAIGGVVPPALAVGLNRVQTGGFFTNPYALVHPWDRLGFGPDVGDPAWHVGYTHAQGFWNLATNVELLQANLFGWPYYVAFALIAIPFMVGRARGWDFLLGASAVGLFAVYLAYFYSGDWLGFPRYTYGAIPWLTLLAARGVQELYDVALRLPFGRAPCRPAALAFPLLLSLGLIVYTWTTFIPAEQSAFIRQAQREDRTAHTLPLDHAQHALIFETIGRRGWWRFGQVMTDDVAYGDVVYARDLQSADRRLMRQYPGWTYYRLDGSRLRPMRLSSE